MHPRICALVDGYAGSDGRGATVAVIDSGVEASHPDLAGVEVVGVVLEERQGRIVLRDYDGVDVAGHGTAVAGLISRVAPGARILSCRVLNRNVRTTSQALLAALDWVRVQPGISVVNLSLGTPSREFGLEIAHRIDALSAAGIPVVTARGYDETPDYPSCFATPFSVAVGDFESLDGLGYRPGSVVEFRAAGRGLRVPWKGGTHIVADGSSFAAPLVAGRLARWKGLEPSLTVWELKTLLQFQATVTLQSSERPRLG